MSINSGSTEIKQIYSGSTEVIVAYSGSNLVFGKDMYDSGDPISLTGEWESFWDSKYIRTYPFTTIVNTVVDISSGIQASITIDPDDVSISGTGITVESGSLLEVPLTGTYTAFVTMGAINCPGGVYFLYRDFTGQTRPTSFNSSGTISENGTLLTQNSTTAILMSGVSGGTLPMAIMTANFSNGDSWVVERVEVKAGDWT